MYYGEHKDDELKVGMKVKTNMSMKVNREIKTNKKWTNKFEHEDAVRVTCLVSMLHNVWSLPHLPSICLPISGRLEGVQRRGQPSDAHCATASQVKDLEVGIAAPTAQMAVGTQRSIFAAWHCFLRAKRARKNSDSLRSLQLAFRFADVLASQPTALSTVKHLLEQGPVVEHNMIPCQNKVLVPGRHWNCISPRTHTCYSQLTRLGPTAVWMAQGAQRGQQVNGPECSSVVEASALLSAMVLERCGRYSSRSDSNKATTVITQSMLPSFSWVLWVTSGSIGVNPGGGGIAMASKLSLTWLATPRGGLEAGTSSLGRRCHLQ